MAKKMLIDATHAEETRVVVVDGTKVEEFDFETINKRQISGNIYLAKVTRVEPSLQAAFVDYGGNRHGFLAFAEIHPDYYQIPAADRAALIAEERAYAEAQEAEEAARARRRKPAPKAQDADQNDEIVSEDVADSAQDTDAAQDAAIGADAVPADLSDMESAEDSSVADDDGHDDSNDETETDTDGDDARPVIEALGDADTHEDVRAPRKPRARRYKIQEVIKVRQIMLIQVVKEERGNKGAALTTYLSLPGRYCVLMPNTARGGGISRKITNIADRKKLKDIAGELDVPKGAGLIIRTAGSQRTRTEIKRDYEYLLRLWEQIRELTFKSIAPAPIYEEGDLIKRTIRDLYSKEIDEVLVEGERGYRTAKDFMKMIMPTHAGSVKNYVDPMPLFARYQVESYLGGMFNPVVQLKSGGYIVIGVTEALVAIDVNSGRATKEGSIEDTALKTNLEAAEEVSRQLRLRDLAGLIVIDFIDMEERKNNAAVEKRLKDKLKSDRARIQVGRISGFGLMEMSRQRLRPGMLESTTQPCAHCHGTGLIRSDDSLALTILRGIEEEGTRKRSREVLVRAPVAVVNFLINAKREHIAGIEARYGLSVRLEADPALISPDYAIEKFKTATRLVPELAQPVLSVDADLMARIDDEDDDFSDDDHETGTDTEMDTDSDEGHSDETPSASDDEDGDGRSRRRRRRRRRKPGERSDADSADDHNNDADSDDAHGDANGDDAVAGDDSAAVPVADNAAPETPENGRRRSRSRSRSRRNGDRPASQDGALPEVVDLREPAAESASGDALRAEAFPSVAAADPAAAPDSQLSMEELPLEPVAEVVEVEGAMTADPVESTPQPMVSDAAVVGPAEGEATDPASPVDELVANDAVAVTEVEVAPVEEKPTQLEEAQPDSDQPTPAQPRRRGWWSAGR